MTTALNLVAPAALPSRVMCTRPPDALPVDDTRRYTLLSWGRGEVLMVQQFRPGEPRGTDQLLACDARPATCGDVPFSGPVPVLPVA